MDVGEHRFCQHGAEAHLPGLIGPVIFVKIRSINRPCELVYQQLEFEQTPVFPGEAIRTSPCYSRASAAPCCTWGEGVGPGVGAKDSPPCPSSAQESTLTNLAQNMLHEFTRRLECRPRSPPESKAMVDQNFAPERALGRRSWANTGAVSSHENLEIGFLAKAQRRRQGGWLTGQPGSPADCVLADSLTGLAAPPK